jgi:RNA-directed DNA polymerase
MRPHYTPKLKKRTALLRELKQVFRRYRSQPVERVISLINPVLRGWVTYFALGHSSECFSYIKDWVAKKVRRHLAQARKRGGFGWEQWSRPYTRAVQQLSSTPLRVESCPSMIGPISLEAKQMGARSAGNPHAACDAEGAGNVARPRYWDTRRRKGEPTGETNFGLTRRASPRPTDERDVETEPRLRQ